MLNAFNKNILNIKEADNRITNVDLSKGASKGFSLLF